MEIERPRMAENLIKEIFSYSHPLLENIAKTPHLINTLGDVPLIRRFSLLFLSRE